MGCAHLVLQALLAAGRAMESVRTLQVVGEDPAGRTRRGKRDMHAWTLRFRAAVNFVLVVRHVPMVRGQLFSDCFSQLVSYNLFDSNRALLLRATS